MTAAATGTPSNEELKDGLLALADALSNVIQQVQHNGPSSIEPTEGLKNAIHLVGEVQGMCRLGTRIDPLT